MRRRKQRGRKGPHGAVERKGYSFRLCVEERLCCGNPDMVMETMKTLI